MESLFVWLVLLHCFTVPNFVNSEIQLDPDLHVDDTEFLIHREPDESSWIASADYQDRASGDFDDTKTQSAGSAPALSPTSTVVVTVSQDGGRRGIADLAVEFRDPETFVVTWQNTPGARCSILVAKRGEPGTIYEYVGILSSSRTLSTTTVPLESFQEYSLTVIEAETGAQATTTFWSPPEPPNIPELELTPMPERLHIEWRAPPNSNKAFLEYWLRICVDYDIQNCKELNVGASARSLSIRTPTVATYSVELRASHRYVFGNFVVESEPQRATEKSCRKNSSTDITLGYDSAKKSVVFSVTLVELFADICGFGAVAEYQVEWARPQNTFTCESPLQHREWEPSSESDPFNCEEGDPGFYRCFIAIGGVQLDKLGDWQVVIKATDKESVHNCAFARSNTVLVASVQEGAPVLPWLILALLVTMSTLGLLYKKREPLWTLATDIINSFNKRNRCLNDIELPRVACFEVRSPGELTRFNEEYHQKKRDMNYTMTLEYEQIQRDSERFMADRSFGSQPELRLKNRYNNIIPFCSLSLDERRTNSPEKLHCLWDVEFNHNRVTLQAQNGEVLSTYINASLVKGSDGRAKCIVCQGPKMESLEDFLRMLIEYDVSLIASLLSIVNIDTDQDKRQCSQYWPREVGASEEFGKYSIKLESESQYDCFVRRNLKISGPGISHRVTQLHFFRWPDHRTPSKTEDLLTFLSVFRKMKRGTPVVHCSAGVGRSGTLVALDFLMDLLERGERAAIPRVVAHLRTQRVSMIQTEEQYLFLYDCIYSALNGKADAKCLSRYLTHTM